MANIQQYFEKFNKIIKAGYKYNEELKEKRDKLLDNLKNNLGLAFSHFNQGSYGMGTGVKPIDGDFDIDIGLIFKESDAEALDFPFQLKNNIYQTIHTNRIKMKTSGVQEAEIITVSTH